jgi:Flavin containing amine oxidoreductase
MRVTPREILLFSFCRSLIFHYDTQGLKNKTKGPSLISQRRHPFASFPQEPIFPTEPEYPILPFKKRKDILDDACKAAEKTTSAPLFQQILCYLGHRSEVFEGGRLYELSVITNELYQYLGGPDDIAEGGYHEVLQKLANAIGRENIHLDCPVRDIYYEPLSNNGDNDENTPGVRIQFCRNGEAETLLADCCVCTVPLGVLQKRAIGFHPFLPLAHLKSIDAMGMGVLDKIMMLFGEQFWEKKIQVGIAHEDPTRIQNFWDCSQDYNEKPVLAMLLGGDAARRFDCKDGLSDDQVMAEAMATLRTLFGDDIPEPLSFQVSRWLQDPYAFGSYSFAKIGSTEQDYDQVAQPGGKNLFFAGEHTSKHHHSTVHGAWDTGKREAERLIQAASKLRPALSKAALKS